MANKVMIVGTGNVGMSYGYALVHQRTSVNELVLVDINVDVQTSRPQERDQIPQFEEWLAKCRLLPHKEKRPPNMRVTSYDGEAGRSRCLYYLIFSVRRQGGI